MINSKHVLALRYNDISVLENHHAATLFQILGLEGCDLFANLSSIDRNYMRKVMIPVILATDMAKHNEVMAQFRSVMPNFNKQDDTHRQKVLDMILHTSDVGNPALSFELATLWSLKIVQEFNEQVWKEEQLKLTVTEFMRVGNDVSSIKKNQIGFISKFYTDFVIQPLYELLVQHIPECEDMLESVIANKFKWENVERL